ncbi:hypothetical protein [Paenibacillus konkukensis]|nr:hypothetical protein [Paenibacillus konkukensis]
MNPEKRQRSPKKNGLEDQMGAAADFFSITFLGKRGGQRPEYPQ